MKPRALFSLGLVAGFLMACTIMPTHRVPNWPQLTIKTHVVEAGQIWTHCKDTLPAWAVIMLAPPVACAWVNLGALTCDVYVTDTTPPCDVQHELKHCLGYEDAGVDSFSRLLANYRAAYPDWNPPIVDDAFAAKVLRGGTS